MTLVAKSLAKMYRPVGIAVWSIIVLIVVLTTAVLAVVYEVKYSLWLIIAGQVMKWWLLVFGVLAVATHLKLYVANGVTRRDFLAGAALFGGLTAALYAMIVVLGHGIERLVWTAFGTPPDTYPAFSALDALREFGHYLPGALGSLVTGALVAAGFYRFTWWIGLLLVIPGLLPLAVADGMFGLYAAVEAPAPRLLPYPAAVAFSLTVTVIGALLLHRQMHDVAIRRTAG
jgi:hypothetical protein